MNTQQIQTLLVLAERAQSNGLVKPDEMMIVYQAIMAGRQAINATEQPEPDQPGEGQKAKK